MKFKSEVVTQASGSIGGVTYSHNKGGMYRRARAIPVNPQTTFQTEVRNAMTAAVNAWTSVLTQGQRDQWDVYASNTPTTDTLGSTITLSGQNWYLAANVPVLQAVAKLAATLTRKDMGPSIYNRGDFTDPVPTYAAASGLSMTFDNTDDWANEDDAAMFVFQGRPQNASRKFFKGPFRLVGAIEGDGTTAPTSPFVANAIVLLGNGYEVSTGDAFWTAVAVVRADGRISTRRIFGPTIAT